MRLRAAAGPGSRRPGRRAARPWGRRVVAAAAGRAGARSPGWRARGRPPARARRAPAGAAVRRLLDRGELEQRVDRQRVAVVGDPGDRRGRGQLAGVEPVERRVAGVHGAHRLQRRPGGGSRATRAVTSHAAAAARRAIAAGRPVGGDGLGGSGTASRSRSGGARPATQPAHSSAGTALPGTNHVQSIAECTPKTITTTASVAMPTRSASQGSPRSRRRRPIARAAAASQATAASSETAQPDPAEVGERLHDVAVGVADGAARRRGSAVRSVA